jgi:PAS domain S-box-containing protein
MRSFLTSLRARLLLLILVTVVPMFLLTAHTNRQWRQYRDLEEMQEVVALARLVAEREGHLAAGSSPAMFDASRLKTVLTEVEAPRGTSITLLDDRGTVLAREPDGSRWVGQSALANQAFGEIVRRHGNGTIEGNDLDGQPKQIAHRTLGDLAPPVRVVVAVPPASVVEEENEIIRESLLLEIAVAMVALVLAWTGASLFVLRPANALLTMTRRLAAGELNARTGVHGSGELHQVSRAFDDMAQALEARAREAERARAALAAAHDALEERVRNRTAELVSANEALKKLSSAVMQAADSVIITNRNGVIEYVNPAFERLTGYTAAEALGQTPRIVKSGVHDAAFYAHLWRQISSGEVFQGIVVNRRKTGTLYHEEKSITPIRDERGTITHYVSAGRDITERKEAEEELEKSRAALRVLAAHLTSVREEERSRIATEVHDELGQFLAVLKLEVQRLARAPVDEAELRRHVSETSELIDQMMASVHRIQTELRPPVLDVLGLVAAIDWQARQFESRTGIRCRFTPSSEDVRVAPDTSTAVFRIVQEALANIVQHAAAHAVEIGLQIAGDTLTLTVRDDGRGITEADLDRQPSLGITGMRERARLLGGRFTVTGRPGEGTTLTLALPLSRSS